jgi:carboxypeptidase Taq
MGYFPTYTLGNVLSVQFFNAAVQAHPEIEHELGQGEFGTLHGWLEEQIYRHGRTLDPNDLIQQATGGPLDTEPYLQYLEAKYGELYGLN